MNDNATTTNDANSQIQKVLPRVHRFTQRHHAEGFARHAEKTQWVMLGDDGRYWVATPADCPRLEGAGYEYAD